jgi:hypothetical protein
MILQDIEVEQNLNYLLMYDIPEKNFRIFPTFFIKCFGVARVRLIFEFLS